MFSTIGRSRMAAMISNSPLPLPLPLLGQCCMSISRAQLQRWLTCTQVMSEVDAAPATAPI
jgi:hypothetical protein